MRYRVHYIRDFNQPALKESFWCDSYETLGDFFIFRTKKAKGYIALNKRFIVMIEYLEPPE